MSVAVRRTICPSRRSKNYAFFLPWQSQDLDHRQSLWRITIYRSLIRTDFEKSFRLLRLLLIPRQDRFFAKPRRMQKEKWRFAIHKEGLSRYRRFSRYARGLRMVAPLNR